MTSIETFLKSSESDIFFDIEYETEYHKSELDHTFQDYQTEGSVTIEEYYDKLVNFLKEFRKVKNTLEVKSIE